VNVRSTALPGVLVIEPKVFSDERGRFLESFNAARYAEAGLSGAFVQDNVSHSRRGVLRGLHFQHPHDQGKLVSVAQGEVFDVAVDVRVGSPTFGQWVGEYLSGENGRQLYVPPGYAHGFFVTADDTIFTYKCTDYYAPSAERSVRWDDPALAIAWPAREALLSPKDAAAPRLADVPRDHLPRWTS
jgi:dTDP-4-dehydrorhamnose 3,5-epimerase